MLHVYTEITHAKMHFGSSVPDRLILDWGDSTPAELATLAETAVQHHETAAVYFGYLDPWMLSPTEEIRIRPLLRKFPVALVTRHPLALPLAWKNELAAVYIGNPYNGTPHTDHHGGLGSNAAPHEHGCAPAETPVDGGTH